MCAIDWPALFGVLKDLALAAAAIVTATVAVRGLQRWSVELRGKADFDVARGLARATYKVRDAVESCRVPYVRGAEYPAGYRTPDANHPADAQVEAEGLAHVYKNRWQPVSAALQEFDAQTLEAEALWGADIRTSAQALRQCTNTLFVAIESIIEDKAAGGHNFEADRGFARLMRANAHASHTATDNALSNAIAAAIEGLEAKLRGHLKRPA